MPRLIDTFKEPRTLAFAAIAVFAAGAILALSGGLATQVTTVAVVRGDAAEVVYATGAVEPRYWAKVVSLQRKRIIEMCQCEGRPVKIGDVLARLDDLEERAALTELQARLARLNDDVVRLKTLLDRNVTSRTTYEEKLTQVQEYEARIAAQRDRLADLVLRAPMEGVVLRRDGEVGEIAGVGVSDVLFWVGQPRPLRIVADVNEEDIFKVTVGQRVLVRHDGAPGPMEAKVDEITPKGDPATKTFRVYLGLPDDTPLRIGMSVEANIVVKEAKGVVLVPAEAISSGAVFTVTDSRVRRVDVRIGIRGARAVEITAGVKDGDVVVSPAKPGLSDGERVKATPAAATSSGGIGAGTAGGTPP